MTSGSPSMRRSRRCSACLGSPTSVHSWQALARLAFTTVAPSRTIFRCGLVAVVKSPAAQLNVAETLPTVTVLDPAATLASAGAATSSTAAASRALRSLNLVAFLRGGRGGGRRRRLVLGLGRLGALLGPGLVELDAPLALLVLHQRELGAERAAGAALEAGHLLGGAAGLDELAHDGGRHRLAGLGLPDDEPAAGIVAAPARVPLAVLDDVASAD